MFLAIIFLALSRVVSILILSLVIRFPWKKVSSFVTKYYTIRFETGFFVFDTLLSGFEKLSLGDDVSFYSL